jgi:hypothetical protein
MGSTRVARRAGMRAAISATIPRTSTAKNIDHGSVAFNPNSIEDNSLVGRIPDRQHFQHNRIHQSEDSRVGSDAQGQRQNRHKSERRVLAQHAYTKANILEEHFHYLPIFAEFVMR